MKNKLVIILLLSIPTLWGCSSISPTHENLPPIGNCEFLDSGLASWYGNELLGNRTANGEMFVPDGITAAHRKLPFGSIVKVLLDNPKAHSKGNPDGVVVRINDRGPFVRGRIIDLSWGAAKQLGMMDTQAVHIYLCK